MRSGQISNFWTVAVKGQRKQSWGEFNIDSIRYEKITFFFKNQNIEGILEIIKYSVVNNRSVKNFMTNCYGFYLVKII
jgi:hypothetical protein